MRALLDVNVLLARFDQDHIHHDQARSWLNTNREYGWASCPLTQNGFVRIRTQAGYRRRITIAEAAGILNAQTELADHQLWPDDISISDPQIFDHSRILGPNQITDLYLLALAVKHEGRLVTFDRGIPLAVVRGAEARHLVVI